MNKCDVFVFYSFDFYANIPKQILYSIGECGGYHSNEDVDEDKIMRFGRVKNVGWIAWSWKGNSSDLNYLDLSYY